MTPRRSMVHGFVLTVLTCGAACAPAATQDPGTNTGGTNVRGTGGANTGGVGAGGAGTGGVAVGTGGSQAMGSGGNASGGQIGSGGANGGGITGGGGTASGGATRSGGNTGGSGRPGTAGTGASGGGTNQGGASVSTGGTAGQAGDGGAPAHNAIVLYDDDGRLLLVNKSNPAANWTVTSGGGRDLQLVGNGRVMLGKSNGWDEYQLSNGAVMGGQHGFSGTQSAHRLADGNTMLASVSGNSVVLKMVTATGQVQRMITYNGYAYVRLVRPTAAGTFLITADTLVFEGNDQGMVLATWPIPGSGQHVWKAMRQANGNTAIATGYNATIMVYSPTRTLLKTIGGKGAAFSALDPHFFADFHVMPNGNYFVVNSQADSSNANSVQMLEFNPDGALVWQQKQPTGVRSLEAAIVLDGLDLTKLHVQPEGVLLPVP